MKIYNKFKQWIEQKKPQSIVEFCIIVSLVATLVILGILISRPSSVITSDNLPIPRVSPKDVPIQTNRPIPFFNPTVIPTNNPNPIITCNSSYPKCLGQSIQVQQSACSNIICCQIGNNWSIYPSAQSCTNAQNNTGSQNNNNNNSNSNNYNPPNYNYPTTESLVSCQTITGTYQLTQQQCDDAHARDQQLYQQYQQTQQANQQAKQDCVNKTTSDYNFMVAKCPTDDGGSCKEMLYQTEQQGIAKCQQ